MNKQRNEHRWSQRYCWERNKKTSPIRLGWKQRALFAEFVAYRLRQHEASLETIEGVLQQGALMVLEAAGDEGNEAWKALEKRA